MEPVGEWPPLVAVPLPVDPAVLKADHADLSKADLDRVWAAVDASTSANTKAAYRSDWARFERWTTEAGYASLPATDLVVAAYLTDAAATVRSDGRAQFSPATLSRWASSINQIHTAAGLPAPGRSEVVRRALSGVRRMRRTPPKRRSPLLLADVRTILTAMSPSFWMWPDSVAAHRDAALLVMGFAGAHRRSELVALHLDDVTVHHADGLHVRMRSSKTDQEAHGAVRALPFGKDPATCPPCALIRWRRLLLAFDQGGRRAAMDQVHSRGLTAEHCCRTVNDSAMNAEPVGDGGQTGERGSVGERWLFPGIHKTGSPGAGPMSGDAVAAMIQRRAAAAGYTPAQVDLLGGHSLRSGFVTEAFRAGADAHSIMRQTGHRDPKMLEVYAREHAPLVGNAVTRIDL